MLEYAVRLPSTSCNGSHLYIQSHHNPSLVIPTEVEGSAFLLRLPGSSERWNMQPVCRLLPAIDRIATSSPTTTLPLSSRPQWRDLLFYRVCRDQANAGICSPLWRMGESLICAIFLPGANNSGGSGCPSSPPTATERTTNQSLSLYGTLVVTCPRKDEMFGGKPGRNKRTDRLGRRGGWGNVK